MAAGRGQLVGVRKFSFPSTSGSSLTPSTSLPQVPSLWVSHSVSHYVRTHELGSDGTAALGHDGRAVKRVPRSSLGASRAAWRAAIDATLVSFEAPAERAPNQDAACSAVAGACLLRGCGTLQELSHLIPRIRHGYNFDPWLPPHPHSVRCRPMTRAKVELTCGLGPRWPATYTSVRQLPKRWGGAPPRDR